jgi:glycosyltransferase involved in cell wall biosynthesis
MLKLNHKIILQYVYDIIIFLGILALLPTIKDGGGNIIGAAIALFLFPFVSNDEKTNRITFSIIHALIAWLSWTAIIAGYFTKFLFTHYIKEEHSLWYLFAYLIPFIFAVLTIIWDLKFRQIQKWYEPAYLFILMAAILIATNCC